METNYKLLSDLIPDIVEILTLNPADSYSHRAKSFYDLDLEVLSKSGSTYRLALGYHYIQNGDRMRAPEFELNVNLKTLECDVVFYADDQCQLFAGNGDGSPLVKEAGFFGTWLKSVLANHGPVFPISEVELSGNHQHRLVFGDRKEQSDHDLEETPKTEPVQDNDSFTKDVDASEIPPEPLDEPQNAKFSLRGVINNNIEVLQTLVDLLENDRIPTIKEKILLSSFRGLGTIRALILSDRYPAEQKTFWQLANRIGEISGISPSEVKKEVEAALSNMYFTPEIIGENLVRSIEKTTGFRFQNILEPAVGTANMIQALLRQERTVTGVEMNFIAAKIAQVLYPSLNVIHGKYEQYVPKEPHDFIISNVPFSNTMVFDPRWVTEREKGAFSNTLHGYYFVKSLENLTDSGVMALIAPTGIMDAPTHRDLRNYLVSHANFLTAIRLPNNTFENTEVTADLIVMQKRGGEPISGEQHHRNELFAGTASIELPVPDTDRKVSFPVSPWYLSETGKENVLGTWAVGHMHGGISLGVAPQAGYNSVLLREDIERAISQAGDFFSWETVEPQESKQRISIDENTPEGRICTDLFALLKDVRKGIPREEMLTRWKNACEDFKNLSESEKASYKRLWNEEYRSEVENFAMEGAIVKLSDAIEWGVANYQKKKSVKEKFDEKVDSALALSVVMPDNCPAQHRILSKLSQDSQERPKLYEKIGFLAKAKDLLKILDKVVQAELTADNTDQDSEELKALRKKMMNAYSEIPQKLLKQCEHIVDEYFPKRQAFDFHQIFAKRDDQGNVVLPDIFRSFEARRGNVEYSNYDWLVKSVNLYGEIDPVYLEANNPGGLKDLIEQEAVFKTPDKEEYLLAERYLSGNVRAKLAEAREAFANGEQGMERNIRALEAIQPEAKPIQEIAEVVNLGERWIPLNYYRDFIRNHLNIKAEVYYQQVEDKYYFEEDVNGRNHNVIEGWKPANYWNVDKVLDKAFSHTMPVITTTKKISVNGVEKEVQVTDEKATRKAAILVEKILSGWKSYCLSNLDFRNFLQKEYNERFNNTVLPKYDGSMLKFEDMVGKTPYPTQKNAIWRLLQGNNGDGIFDHFVGAGKSLIIAAGAHELKRVGKAKKVLVTGLGANVKELYREHKQLYPNDKVLFVGKEFSGAKRGEILAKIRSEDWTAVYMPHSQFSMIPHNKTIVLKEINDQLDAINEAVKDQMTQKQKKGLISRKINLEARLNKMTAMIKKDAGLPVFTELGIDHVMVDESHVFKNLGFATRHANLAGLGNAEGSLRALNMLFTCRSIQEIKGRDCGISFFSGTPVSNSLTELYSLQRYLSPSLLQERGIYSLDSWLTTYGDISTDYEVTVTGTIAPKERLRGILKADQLVKDYWMMADVVQRTDKNVTSDAPKLDSELVKLPPTPVQEVFNDLFLAFALANSPEEAQWIAPLLFDDMGKYIDEGYLQAKMVVVASMARQTSMHMGLRRSDMTDFYSPKIETMITNAMKFYEETKEQKGTQIIFSNTGTPNSNGFNIYSHIRQRLVEQGVPAKEIAFIHDFDTDAKRESLFDQVNKGNIRFVLGSTEKCGTGTNIQERCVCMHNLDIPWRPDEVRQRNGRGARQGNRLAKELYQNNVKAYFYATEKMLDVMQYNLLSVKQNITDVLHAPETVNGVFKIDNTNEDGTPSFDQFVADLSGDDDMLKKLKLEKQIEDLELRQHVFLDKRASLEEELKRAGKKLEVSQSNLEYMSKEKEYLSAQLEKAGCSSLADISIENEFNLSFMRKESVKLKHNDEIGNLLLYVLRENKTPGDHVICSYYGYDLVASRTVESTGISQAQEITSNYIALKNRESGLNYRLSLDDRRSSRLAGLWIKDTLKGIITKVDSTSARIEKEKSVYDSLDRQLKEYPNDFPQGKLIPELKVELGELTKRVLKNGESIINARKSNIQKLKERYGNNPQLFVEEMRMIDREYRQKIGQQAVFPERERKDMAPAIQANEEYSRRPSSQLKLF